MNCIIQAYEGGIYVLIAYRKETLQIPAEMEVEAIIGAGYPDEEKPGHGKEELLFERIHNDYY